MQTADSTTRIDNFALVVGAMKAGTTSLCDHLAGHPAIVRCSVKEPNFFGSSRWNDGPEGYYRLWPDFDPARHRWALEGSTHYTKHPRHSRAAERIAGFGARFKLLYMVRDPIDRIESHIAHNIAKGRIGVHDYPRGLDQAVNVSRYAMQLDRLRAAGGEPDILVLDFDALRDDPAPLLRRCLEFLDLDPGFAFPERPPSNPRRASHGAEHFRLTAAERADLAETLRADMLRFRDTWGFNVTKWGFF